ncbi:glycosyltransferase [Flavobacteriaceae bacterium TK19130]|nr:glycosyltransferase [Thermobacterium salinum]
MGAQKTILVAPLNWGLGHATRCIPIIKALQEEGYGIRLASDGASLALLKKEFPTLPFYQLPSYDITYPQNAEWFKLKLLLQLPKVWRAVKEERKMVGKWVANGEIDGIISDNRLGVSHSAVPSVYITHQCKVISGTTTAISSWLHNRFISKFDECWIPDYEGPFTLSGSMGHHGKPPIPKKYIGPLSRFQQQALHKKYNVLCLVSGPEPQRTQFEQKLQEAFASSSKKIVLVQGVMEEEQQWIKKGNMFIVNYMTSSELEKTFNSSDVVVARSGYSTIMDISALRKKAYLVPTPGQYEQLYLARRLKDKGIFPSCQQHHFTEEKLQELPLFKGMDNIEEPFPLARLFRLFEGEGKL